jgi:fibronectin type 3 domain-containing protein
MKFIQKLCLSVAIASVLSCVAVNAQTFIHPCIPATTRDLDYIKANLDKEPWKSGYAQLLAGTDTNRVAQPYANVQRSPNLNLGAWSGDMGAVFSLARMWYFTGDNNYAQRAHDILLAWANTQTNMGGSEAGLALGDLAQAYGGGASILRGTWPGWTEADTAAVKHLFGNVYWPRIAPAGNIQGPANKGSLNMMAGMAIALFCDDTNKFNHVLNLYRTYPGSGLPNTLATGEMGETGRDAGHAYGDLLGKTFIAECAWKQGIDLYSEWDNRLLAVGEYYCRNIFETDNPFVHYGTVDFLYLENAEGPYGANRAALYLIQNAYKNRKGLPTPWIDRKLTEQWLDTVNFMYARTADFSTATPPAAIVRPPVSLASSGLTLTTLGNNSAGRSSSYANGIWTMTGAGLDVWGEVNDDCQFAYQTMTGDCAIVARVTSAQSINGATKAGVMIRDNLSASVSQRGFAAIIPNATTQVQSRLAGDTERWAGRVAQTTDLPSPGMPYWVKLERRGYVFTAYTSPDGTSWSPNVCNYFANMPSTLYVGLFVVSGSATTTTTATFDNVAFTGGTGGLVTTPAAPAALLASGSGKAITLRWLPSFGATAYDVLRSTTSGSGYTVIASNLSADNTSYADTTAAAGTTYYYVVQAKNSAGTSGDSPEFYGARLPARMVNLAFGGTPTASFNQDSVIEGAIKAFDSDPGSKWYGYNSPANWLQYDFGAGNAQVVKRYTISVADVATRDPKDWTFLGSQDGSTWTTLDSQSNQTFPNRLQNIYDLGNTTAYRYYRLDITANNGAGGVAVGDLGLWSDSGRTIPSGRYQLVSRNSNKVIDVTAATNGTPLVQQTFNGSNTQQWDITWHGNGQYRATNVANAKVMDNGGTSNAGDNLVIQPWSGANSQLWRIFPDSDGFYHITSENSGLVADVSGGSTADGANIVQGNYSGSDSQLWMPSFTTAPQPIPPAPTGLAASPASISQINLSWTASPGAISYNIKRATVSGGPYTTVTVSVNTTNYLAGGLNSATTYYYVVSAVNGSGESANSVEASATTLAAPPAAPTGLSAILGHNQVTLSWNASAAATSYNVKRATTSGGPYTAVAIGVTNTTYTNTGLTNGVTYYFVVSASNAIGTGSDSAEISATPSTVVVHVKFDETSGTSATDSSGRTFHASLINGPTFGVGTFGNALVLVTNSLATAKYARLPNGVTSGITNFTVSTWVWMNSIETWQRIFDFGTGSGNYMFLTTQYTPTAPNNAKLRFGIRVNSGTEQNVSGNSITLPTNAWTHVAVTRSNNTVSLYINGALAGSGNITLNPADLGVPTQNYLGKSQFGDPYLDGNLDDFRLYSHAMSAGEITALANPAAGAPLQLALVPGYGQATLNWLPNATTSYTVKRSTTSGGPYSTIITGLTNLTYTDTGLTNGVTYYYVVSGANGGGSGPDSAEVSITPGELGLHLKFDESAGTTAADSSFRAQHATLVNAPTFTAGKINNALTLASSSSQHATLPTGVLDGLTNCTIMGWVKLGTVVTWQRIFDFGTGTTNYMFLTTQYGTGGTSNKLRFAIRTPGVPETAANQLSSSVTTPIGSWAHVAVVLSGSTGRLYLNGSQVALSTTMTLNPSSLGVTTKNYLGKSQFNDPHFDGSLDDFHIYSRALTVGEIAQFQTPLVAPNGLEATPGNAQVQLAWNTVANATNYTLSRSSNSGGPYAPIAQLDGTNFTDTNVVNGGTYYYVVRAANFTGESPDSLPVSAQLVSLVPPNLSFTISGGELQFSWPADHTGWRLQMNTNLSTTNWQDIPDSNTANSVSIPFTNGNAFFRLVYP